MEEVQKTAINNALDPFSNFGEIESYLKKQWAGLLYNFLARQAESERVGDMLKTLTDLNKRIEFLSTQILSSVGKEYEKINFELYDFMRGYNTKTGIFNLLQSMGYNIVPVQIISSENSLDFLKNSSVKFEKATEKGKDILIIDGLVKCDETSVNNFEAEYQKLRKMLQYILARHDKKPEEFVETIRLRGLMKDNSS